jgi:hypothetical protein
MAALGPRLPTWASREVVGYLGDTGCDANIPREAAHGSRPPIWALQQVGGHLIRHQTATIDKLVNDGAATGITQAIKRPSTGAVCRVGLAILGSGGLLGCRLQRL